LEPGCEAAWGLLADRRSNYLSSKTEVGSTCRAETQDVAFYVTFAPVVTPLAELAAVAGLRWKIEECFQSAKGGTGLDRCEARSWQAGVGT